MVISFDFPTAMMRDSGGALIRVELLVFRGGTSIVHTVDVMTPGSRVVHASVSGGAGRRRGEALERMGRVLRVAIHATFGHAGEIERGQLGVFAACRLRERVGMMMKAFVQLEKLRRQRPLQLMQFLRA